MGKTKRDEIAISGTTADMGFLAAILRKQQIPFRQIPLFSRRPVFCIPRSFEPQIEAILQESAGKREFYRMPQEELSEMQDTFRLLIVAILGLILLPWFRFFYRKFH